MSVLIIILLGVILFIGYVVLIKQDEINDNEKKHIEIEFESWKRHSIKLDKVSENYEESLENARTVINDVVTEVLELSKPPKFTFINSRGRILTTELKNFNKYYSKYEFLGVV